MTRTLSTPSADVPVHADLSGEFERRIAFTRKSIGISLQRIRLARGLSCREVGRLASFGPNTANKLEANCAGTIDSFVRMGAALNLGNALARLFQDFQSRAVGSAVSAGPARNEQGPFEGGLEGPVTSLHVLVAASLKAVRVARLLSQEEAARRSGVHVRTVWNVESRLAGTMNSLLRLAEAFGIASELQQLLEDRAQSESVVITPVNRRFAALLWSEPVLARV